MTVFDLARVKWREPGMERAVRCCYCQAPFAPDDPRLLLVDNGGFGADLCVRCDALYFSWVSLP